MRRSGCGGCLLYALLSPVVFVVVLGWPFAATGSVWAVFAWWVLLAAAAVALVRRSRR
jgi:hypothetical protein